MRSCPLAAGVPVVPDFSSCARVPSAGRRLRVSIRTAYDFATLKRMFGIASDTKRSNMGRIDSLMMSRVITGARVCPVLVLVSHDGKETYRDCKAGGHPVEIVRVLSHRHDFRNDSVVRPLYTKHLCKFFQV